MGSSITYKVGDPAMWVPVPIVTTNNCQTTCNVQYTNYYGHPWWEQWSQPDVYRIQTNDKSRVKPDTWKAYEGITVYTSSPAGCDEVNPITIILTLDGSGPDPDPDPDAPSCGDAELSIISSIIDSNPISYKIGYAADVQIFSQDKVTSTVDGCPGYAFTLTDQSGGATDSSVFTYSATDASLTTFSDDLSKADTYSLRLTAVFDSDTVL